MSLDFGVMFTITVALLAFLVGLPITLFFTTNLSERYETKVRKIIIGILGALEQPLQHLRELPAITNHTTGQTELVGDDVETTDIPIVPNEREQYRNHQQFIIFVENNLLDLFNDYHNMKTIQDRFESNTNGILFKICFFVIPGILLEFYDNWGFTFLAFISFYVLSLWITPNLGRLRSDINTIKKAYAKYVSEEIVFGDYD